LTAVRSAAYMAPSLISVYVLGALFTADVDADVHVPKVNTAILQVHTPGPSFLLFGFPKCGTTTLWDWITQHPKLSRARITARWSTCVEGDPLVGQRALTSRRRADRLRRLAT
jgi:hypothetical protein